MFAKLVTTRRLDREVMSETSVTLACTDHGQPALTSDVTLAVRVLDLNDHAPRFEVKSYRADVVENSFIGTFVTRVSASDDDDGDNGLIQYIIGNSRQLSSADGRSRDKTKRQKDGKRRNGRRRGRRQLNTIATRHNNTEDGSLYESGESRPRVASDGDCVGRVNVDPDSGVVTVVGLIDFEYSSVINCRILAIDSGSPPKTGE